MNDTFNLQRFSLLFKKSLLERPVQMLGLIGLTMVISFLAYVILKNITGFQEGQNVSFVFGLVGGGTFLASFVFSNFSSNAAGSSYLTLPASHFEKWLCGVLITGVLFTALFLLCFRLMDVLMVMFYHNNLNVHDPYYKEKFDMVHTFSLTGFVAIKIYIMFLNFSGAMLIGSLYFNKGAFIKVALIVCSLLIGSAFLDYYIAKLFFVSVDRALPYYSVFIPVANSFGKVVLPGNASKAVDISLLYILPAILWLVTYVRLREKEF